MGRSLLKVDELAKSTLTNEALLARETELRARFDADLATDAWRRTFRGRDVLKEFARLNSTSSYEVIRNLIIARMSDAGHRPAGMKDVVEAILAA
jgi:hypothetical protein